MKNEKIIALGDIHSKSSLILPYVEKVIEVERPTKLIFLGDYVDEAYAPSYLIIDELKHLIDFYNNYRNTIDMIMLCGNHDYQYLIEHGYCSSTDLSIKNEVKSLLEQLDLRLSYAFNDYLFTHAGLESSWANYYIKDIDINDIESISNLLNEMLKIKDDSLNEASATRGGDWYPSPIWADKRDHLYDENPLKINQVFGHSPVEHVEEIISSNYSKSDIDRKLFACDTFSRKRMGEPIGDASVLVLEGTNKEYSTLKTHIVVPKDYGCKEYSYENIADWEIEHY